MIDTRDPEWFIRVTLLCGTGDPIQGFLRIPLVVHRHRILCFLTVLLNLMGRLVAWPLCTTKNLGAKLAQNDQWSKWISERMLVLHIRNWLWLIWLLTPWKRRCSWSKIIRQSARLVAIYDLNGRHPRNTLHNACYCTLMPVRQLDYAGLLFSNRMIFVSRG